VRSEPFGAGGPAVPVVGQGTWTMEGDRQEAIAALRRGLDLGMTHVDTAEMYGDGAVEELVGEAIAGRRDEVFLVSKVLPGNASRRRTIAACRRSLDRLGVAALDCYLLHWPSDQPLAGTVEAFEELVAGGWIRSWGVSNFDETELAALLRVAGEGRVACNQVLWHLQQRAVEHAVVPFCREHGIAVVAYSPFGGRRGRFPAPGTPGGDVLAEVAATHGATPRQVALAFLLRQGAFVIPKSSRVAHVEENAGAADLELSEAEAARIDAAFPLGRRRAGIPTS
jgi:diketogulonate reductase-like aldo/keto reductase